MKNKEFHESAETFLRELRMSLPPPDSFETIHNMMGTIREYREYAQPNSPSWDKYILDVFNILGFNTKYETKGLISLSEMGGKRSKQAIVELIKLDEKFDDFVPDKGWTITLAFRLLIHEIEGDWVILTNGQKIKIFNFNHNPKKFYLQVNLEAILKDDNFDDFFDFCNIISLIRGKPIHAIEQPVPKRKKQTGRYDLNHHLANKSNRVIVLFEVLRSKIKSLSSQIEERFKKMYIGYYSGKSFCQIRPQKGQLKIWVNLDIHQLSAPLSLCRDVRTVGHYGTGKTEIVLKRFDELEGVFDVIRQAYKISIKDTQNYNRNQWRQDRHKLRHKFWAELLEKANRKTSLHAKISPGDGNRLRISAGKSGLSFAYVVRLNDAHVELYINNGHRMWNKSTFEYFYQHKEEIDGHRMWNKNTFEYFYQHKEEIEAEFGGTLDWQLRENKRASRIRFLIYDSGYKDQYYWSELQDLMIDGMIRLHKAFQPFIAQID